MRKTALFVALFVVLSAFVFAQQGVHEPGTGLEQPELREAARIANATPQLISARLGAGNGTGLIRFQNRTHLYAGLANALIRVRNENARQRIQTNMEKFMERYQEKLGRLQDIEMDVDEDTEAVEIRAKQNVRFLGFIRGRATKRFSMNNQGEITERAPWYRFMYREVDSEE